MGSLHGRRMVELIRDFAPHLDAEAEAEALAAAEGPDTNGVYEVEGARALLQGLPPGRWAIATSGNHLTATTRITHTGLPSPAVLVTADDVRRGKPDPEPYLLAASRLGIAPERCVVIEDAPAGIAAAQAAGMKAIGLATTHTPAELANADAIAPHLRALHITPNGDGSLMVSLTG